MIRLAVPALRSALLAGVAAVALSMSASATELVLSTSEFQANTGDAASLTAGQAITVGGVSQGTALAGDANLSVFTNSKPDANFGITSPLAITTLNYLGGSTSAASVYSSGNVLPTSTIVTSFPSKSEGSLYLTADGTSVTVAGYQVTSSTNPVGALDVSNSSTSANTIAAGVTAGNSPIIDNRVVAQVAVGTDQVISSTTTNAYSGNNARGAILVNGSYYLVGNGNLGNTGVEQLTPGNNAGTTASSANNSTQIGTYNITQNGYTADKAIKDNNFRGETVYNGTLYVTKGSGSNGIDTVYQVGATGALNAGGSLTSNASISVLPGFPTGLAKPGAAYTPFGLFFANATTLYVADEGTGAAGVDTGLGSHAGLEKWSLVGGVWQLVYTLQAGLIGHTDTYSATGFTGTVTTQGLRDITGVVNSDGSVTIYGVSSTTDNITNMDNGADPNALWSITDNINTTTLPTNEQFSEVVAPTLGVVVRGVAAVPEPASLVLIGSGLAALAGLRRRRRG
jgi:hypothetical protein